MRRLALFLAVATSLAGVCPAASAEKDRPFSIDALLSYERIGNVRISPDGGWVVVERQAPYDTARTFRYQFNTATLLTRLEIHPVEAAAGVRTVGTADGSFGIRSGPFSPDGRRMAIYRLTADQLRLGVLTLASGEIEWLPATPELTQFGRTITWRNNDELLVVTRPLDDLPVQFRVAYAVQDRVPELWAATAHGQHAGVIAIPSGRDRDERPHPAPSELRLYDLRTGSARVLDRGEYIDVALSPNGDHFAALKEDEDLAIDPDRPVLVGAPLRRRRLVVGVLETGEVHEPLPDEDFAMYLLSWSPDSGCLVAYGRPSGAEDFDGAGRFWRVDVRGTSRPLALAGMTPWIERTWDHVPIPIAAWDGDRPIVQVRTAAGERAWIRADEPTPPAIPVPNSSERITSIAGRTFRERPDGLFDLTDDGLAVKGRLVDQGQSIDEGNPQAWNPGGPGRDRRVAIEGGCLTPLSALETQTCLQPPGLDERIVAAGPAGDFFVTTFQAADGPSGVRLHNAKGVRDLATVNEGRASTRWGRIEPVRHTGPGGEPLTSWLLLPPNLPAGRRPPVVVVVYPGAALNAPPRSLQPGTTTLQNNEALIAEAGYAVLSASLPNPSGPRRLNDDLADRILAIVAEADRLGLVDGERIAVMGHSYGGYNALLAATQSDRFKAVIASNGYADLTRSMELPPFFRLSPQDGVPIGQLAGWGETGQGSVGVFPENPQAYVDASPYFAVDRLHTPALLMETDLDNARFGGLFSALYRLDRDALLVTYYGEGHVLASPGNVRDFQARILDWLERYLGPPDLIDPSLPVARPGFEDRGQEGSVGPLRPD